jgi:uncharacterized protein
MVGIPFNRRQMLLAAGLGPMVPGLRAQAAAGLGPLAPGLTASASASASQAQAAAAGALEVFDYQGVRLLPSRWRTQQDAVLDYYLAVPTDNYLRGFRRRAGRPAPGAELGGWYSADFFNPFGQIVSGLARLHAATGRVSARTKVLALTAGFRECIGPDGFFFYSANPNATHYGYDKALCGLLDAWLYCGDTNGRDAMLPISLWALGNLSQERLYSGLPIEWYTLSENLYRAYLATGNAGYRDYGRIWEYRGFWDHFHPAPGEDWFVNPTTGEPWPLYHAYSHVNSLSGLGAGWLAFGDEYYRAALGIAHDTIRATQTYATGGFGPYELLLNSRPTLAALLRNPFTHSHFETQCGSWAVFKAAKYLLRLTGDARYGDWAEQVLYNGVGASMQSLADGRVQYFSDYSARGGVKAASNAWSCCAGTRPQVVADYTDMVFLRAAGSLYVNLFLPATVDWTVAGGRLRARLETTFPESDVVRLVIEEAPATSLAVRLRAPGWLAAAPAARVNGSPVTVSADALHWLPFTRVWRAGDVLEVTLPTGARPRLVRVDAAAAYPVAMVQGPVVLAYGATINPARATPPQSIVDSLQRVPGTLDYRAGTSVAVRPFYAYQPGQRYFAHLDPSVGPYVSYTGAWGDNWVWSYTSTSATNAAAEAEFEGTGIRWRWRKLDDAGIARVEVDGRVIGIVDQWDPAGNDSWRLGKPGSAQFGGLAAGRHRIRIVCLGTHNGFSRGVTVNLQDFEDLGPEAAADVTYSGPWNLNLSMAYTNATGSAAEVQLPGTGIRWRWERFDDAGIARVEIDGRVVGTVDQYGPQRNVPAQSDFTGLGPGPHRIRVVCTGTKRAASSNTYLNSLGFASL